MSNNTDPRNAPPPNSRLGPRTEFPGPNERSRSLPPIDPALPRPQEPSRG